MNTNLWVHDAWADKVAEQPTAAALNDQGCVTLTITLPARFLMLFHENCDGGVAIAPYSDCYPEFSFSADSEFGRELVQRGLVIHMCRSRR